MIRIGIIGAGKVVQRAYLSGFSELGSENSKTDFDWYDFKGCENGRVVALCDTDVEKAKKLAERYRIQEVYGNWQEIINHKEIDAVCITTPNYLHAEMAITVAEAGKHILVEKPIALNLKQADSMIATASRNGVILMVDQTFRFSPAIEVARDIIQKGILGRITSIKSKFGTPGPDRWAPGSTWFFSKEQAGYGVLLDVGIHAIGLMRDLSGRGVKEIAAMGASLVKNIEMDDNIICCLKFDDESLGLLEASWTSITDVSIIVSGENGLLEVKLGETPPVKLKLNSYKFDKGPNARKVKELVGVKGVTKNDSFFPDIPSRSKYGGPFQYFVNCVLENKKPFTSGEEGKANLEVIIAGYESLKDRKFISLPLSTER